MKLKSIAAAGFFVATLTSSALAVEAQDFADALTKMFAQAEVNVSFDNVTLQGNDIIVEGVNAAPTGGRPKQFDAKIVFNNVGETADGGYTADRATIDRFVFEKNDVTLRLDGFVWENVLFYQTPPTDGLANIYHQSRFFTGPFRVLIGGDEVFRIASMESGNQTDEENGTVSYDYSARGVSIDVAKLAKLEGGEGLPPEIAEFDLDVLNLETAGHSVLNIADGRFELTDAFIDVDQIGRLSIAADILGYDESFISEIYALQRDAAAADGLSADDQMEQVMRIATALFLDGARLRFDDDGITNKLLDMAADEQGIPRAAMTIGFAAALPIMASEMGVSETLQTALLRAATDYMIRPRSFEVGLEPNKPVRFSRLAAALEDEDTEALLKMFNFEVTANQDQGAGR